MLTAERLRELLDYDPETGVFTRRTDNRRGMRVGDVAGTLHHDGYVYIYVDGANYVAHRLAWLHVHGRWPVSDLDHVHGKEAGNGIANLREASEKINMQNERKARVTNRCGLLGVHWRKDRSTWVATIRVNGRHRRLGSFDTPEEAHAAYLAAKRIHHPGCTI